jgi:hypothetical protein
MSLGTKDGRLIAIDWKDYKYEASYIFLDDSKQIEYLIPKEEIDKLNKIAEELVKNVRKQTVQTS